MADIKKIPPLENKRFCGNCKFYQLVMPDEFHFQWSRGFACKSKNANPDKKDPKGEPLTYYHKPCKFWEW